MKEHALIVRLALYQPDIPQNLGSAIRLCACFGVGLDVVDPCGFPLTDKALKRAALDYGDYASVIRHPHFAAFLSAPERRGGRLVLLETTGAVGLYDHAFAPGDTLILGRESAGSPPELVAGAAAVLRIPMAAGLRSLNVITAGAVALAEALRQTGGMAALWDQDKGPDRP
jgi:tRNA (cytidine/uridine-2'-O-)-methyltransferase